MSGIWFISLSILYTILKEKLYFICYYHIHENISIYNQVGMNNVMWNWNRRVLRERDWALNLCEREIGIIESEIVIIKREIRIIKSKIGLIESEIGIIQSEIRIIESEIAV